MVEPFLKATLKARRFSARVVGMGGGFLSTTREMVRLSCKAVKSKNQNHGLKDYLCDFRHR